MAAKRGVFINVQSAPAFGQEKTHQDARFYTGSKQQPKFAGTLRLPNAEWEYLNTVIVEGFKAVESKKKDKGEESEGAPPGVTIN